MELEMATVAAMVGGADGKVAFKQQATTKYRGSGKSGCVSGGNIGSSGGGGGGGGGSRRGQIKE